MDLSASEVEYLFHHLVLPPQLPQEDDWSQRHCDCLLQFVDEVFTDYLDLAGTGTSNLFLSTIKEMVHRMTSHVIWSCGR